VASLDVDDEAAASPVERVSLTASSELPALAVALSLPEVRVSSPVVIVEVDGIVVDCAAEVRAEVAVVRV
jgi:hypothetical protein